MRSGDTASVLVDISALPVLREIEDRGDVIRIGALATHWDVETSPLLGARLPAFQDAWKTIGNVRIRMTGTVGGNLMAVERAYDGSVLLGAIGAQLVFLTDAGEISLSASSASQDYPDRSLLTAIDIPVSSTARLGFDRSLKPVVSVAVGLDGEAVSVGVGCAYTTPFFWSGNASDVEVTFSAALPDPIDNPMGGAAYRQRMIGVLSRRLLDRLQRGDAS